MWYNNPIKIIGDKNMFGALLRSRKFWLMVFDVLVSTAVYFVTKYVSPDLAENILWLIGSWQPVIIAVIVGIAVEDAAEKRGL